MLLRQGILLCKCLPKRPVPIFLHWMQQELLLRPPCCVTGSSTVLPRQCIASWDTHGLLLQGDGLPNFSARAASEPFSPLEVQANRLKNNNNKRSVLNSAIRISDLTKKILCWEDDMRKAARCMPMAPKSR